MPTKDGRDLNEVQFWNEVEFHSNAGVICDLDSVPVSLCIQRQLLATKPKVDFAYLWFFCFVFFVFAVLGLELRVHTLSHSTTLFCEGFF
jgi:hypothetical protein